MTAFPQTYTENTRDAFIEAHMPLVQRLAGLYVDKGVDYDDLVQEGAIGLMIAADKFDVDRGYQFSTYATWWIRQRMLLAITEHGDTVRKPQNYGALTKWHMKAVESFIAANGREPEVEDLLADSGHKRKTLEYLAKRTKEALSLNIIADYRDPHAPIEYIDLIRDDSEYGRPEAAYLDSELRTDLESALATLRDRERDVLILRYGLSGEKPLSLTAIGKIMGCSGEWINQLETRAIEKIRRQSKLKRLLESHKNA